MPEAPRGHGTGEARERRPSARRPSRRKGEPRRGHRSAVALLAAQATGEQLGSGKPHERSGHEIRPAGIWAKKTVESVGNAEGGWCREGWIPAGRYGRPGLSRAVGEETPGEVHSPSAGGCGWRVVVGLRGERQPEERRAPASNPAATARRKSLMGPAGNGKGQAGMGETSCHPIESSRNL